jgi:hypothetical protein
MATPVMEKILADTYSVEQLTRRLRKLRSHYVKTFFGEQGAAEQDPFTDPVDIKWFFESLGQDFGQAFNKDNVYHLFDQLNEEAKTLTPLTTYFAFSLPETELVNITQSLRKNYQRPILLDAKIDPNLIAGCAFIVNGVYKDYSVRKKIEDNKQTILAEFERYLNEPQ